MALRVHTMRECPEKLQHVGIAVTLLRERGQQHVGIIHMDDSTSEVCMLHLAWHHDLRNSNPKTSYAWIAPPIHKLRARQVAAFCRKVYRSNSHSGIPYAFSPASDCFDVQSGAFMLGPHRIGLTCASFVLGVFDSTGLPLIHYDEWPPSRSGDEDWQQSIIQELEKDGASTEHIRAVKSEVGSVRYRPADVAGAGAADSLPAHYSEVERLAPEILSILRAQNCFTGQ